VTVGVFKGHNKEILLKEFRIPLPFLKEEPYNTNNLRLDLSDIKGPKDYD